ncbi:MAG: TonB-dependent receptor [Bacteroidota bacterium]
MKLHRSLLVGLLCAALAPLCVAQSNAPIQGVVINGETNEALPGATIYLEGTTLGAASGLDGRFSLLRVDPGTYTLVASLVGYETQRETVTVTRGATVEVSFTLVPQPIRLDEVLTLADRPYSAASSVAIRQFDLLTRPARSAQDLLQITPGLIIAQHAGGGKAEQIFMRGFDADHGTDVYLAVDGMPVNMVSHGHGQGYADLHFVIPETIQQIDVQKGPYAAQYGNLATAGAVEMTTKNHLEHNLIRLEGGAFDTRSVTTLLQVPLPNTDHQGAYLAGQFYDTDGPVESAQGFQRFNLFGKFHTHMSDNTQLSLSASGFSSAWDASGQIPQRAVDQGLITRFGSVDDLEGGSTGRQNLNLTYRATSPTGAFELQTYATRYTFKLFSNFTFFLEDPAAGDMIEQTDNRNLFGVNGTYRFAHTLGGASASTSLGGGVRADDATVGLWKSPDRVREEVLVDADVVERNLFLWGEQEVILSPRLRLKLGLRGDYFTFDVNDRLDGDTTATLPHASGYGQQAILSPKASVVVTPVDGLDVFFNAGSGFHSNDARNVVIGERVRDLARVMERQGMSDEEIDADLAARNFDPTQRRVDTLPRAIGAEVGLRTLLLDRLTVAGAAWWLDLEREYVYVGDGGFTELSGQSRRYGLDLEARLTLTSWLTADADVNLSRGFFPDEPDGADEIPLAPRVTSTGGFTVLRPNGLEGSLRFVHIGDRPANEDNSVTAEGFTVFNLFAAYPVGDFKVSLTVENLFDVAWNEAQFDTESQLPGELAPVSELHFTPGNPRNLRLGLAYAF